MSECAEACVCKGICVYVHRHVYKQVHVCAFGCVRALVCVGVSLIGQDNFPGSFLQFDS